jgi:hypothetical protein
MRELEYEIYARGFGKGKYLYSTQQKQANKQTNKPTNKQTKNGTTAVYILYRTTST